jgi:hypothetical protein
MVKCTWPEFRRKIGTMDEKRTKSLGNSLIGAFNGSILVGCVGSSGFDMVSKTSKELMNLGSRLEEFTDLIDVNVFVLNFGETMFEKKLGEPTDRRSFGDVRATKEFKRGSTRM